MTQPIPFLITTRVERSPEALRAELKAWRKELLLRILKKLGRFALIAAVWTLVVLTFVIVMTLISEVVIAIFGSGFIGQFIIGLFAGAVIITFDKLLTPSRY